MTWFGRLLLSVNNTLSKYFDTLLFSWLICCSDFNPPEPTPEKGQCELRKPQAQAALPRILDPMPFPKGLLETLAHTAAFVDQAGYLAKYAQDVSPLSLVRHY